MSAPTLTRSPEQRAPSANDDLVYLGAGPLLAILLGFALTPFRETVGAGNLSFAFVVLTVVISAFGGRGAGVATALASALSLDFFLTKPYLSLRITENHDVVAFTGLTVCGLVAASLGSPQRIAALREYRSHFQLLHQTLAALEEGGPVETELARLLEQARQILPIRALVLRDPSGRVVASAPHQAGLEPIPARMVATDTLLTPGSSPSALRRAPSLPSEGSRIAIVSHQRQVAWLDFWGDGAPATEASRRALSDVARLFGAMLARETAR
jgi:K+-sensing histidine kinase KdpD